MSDEFIWVVPGNPKKVGIIETHPKHPGGIARVVGDAMDPESVKPVEVYPTTRIHHALGRGYIEQVAEPKAEKKATPKRARRVKKDAQTPEVKTFDQPAKGEAEADEG